MPEGSATDGSENDVTLDESWLEENKDRLIGWDLMRQLSFKSMEPVPPKELADKIGEDKKFVYWILQKLKDPAKRTLEEHDVD